MPAIDAKVGVSGQEYGIAQCLSHADKTGICEAHGNVGVLLQQAKHRFHFLTEAKAADQSIAAKQRGEAANASRAEEMCRLRESRFAGSPRRRVM